MEQPPGYVDPRYPRYPNHVCRLNKALYGLKQAPWAWFHRFSTFLLQFGFRCSRADPSLFVYQRKVSTFYLLVYVDDIVLTGSNPRLLKDFIARLSNEFAMKDLGDLHYFLGIEVHHTPQGLFLSQSKYALDILERASMVDCKPISTPMVVGQHLSGNGSPYANLTHFRSIVGALQYLTITRPDLAHSVNTMCQFMHAPTEEHYQAVKHILRYIKGSLHFGLTIYSDSERRLLAYSNADWAGCPDTRRSTSGFAVFLGRNLISWNAKKQPTVSRSSAKSEYRSLAITAVELTWLSHLLWELRLPVVPATILCDNRSAIFMSYNPVSHNQSKHIALDYHFVREKVAAGHLPVQFVPSAFQIADLFTKSLSRPQFLFFRSKLNVSPPTLSLREGAPDPDQYGKT